jgi:permuted papain-like amidase YaeF/Yiix C92 family enzyme
MMRLVVLVVVATGCHEPKSLIVHRPEDPQADAAVTRMWTHEIRGVARDGDWILSRSYWLAADAITLGTGGEGISHASIYDARHGTVIEAVGSGVREIPLEQLVERNHYLIVVRPNGMTAAEESLAVARARLKLGVEFDGAGMLGLDDPETFYCSELVWWASEGQSRTEDEPVVITPSDLIKYGEVIYYSGKRDDEQIMELALDRT